MTDRVPAAPAPFPLETLRALLGRLIPGDEFPGALEAQTETYVLRQLAGDCAAEAANLTQGLRHLDLESTARHAGLNFMALRETQQDDLLRAIESGDVAVAWPKGISATDFFARMVELAHEGFYADPANGGNRGAVSWRMIGYDPRTPPSVDRRESKARAES